MLETGCLPLPTLLSHSTASLYITIFKIEAKHNIHWTGTRTHAHRRLPTTAGRQPHSKSTKECIQLPSKKGGLKPLGPQTALLPTLALLAARGREAGAGRAVPAWQVTDCGAKEADQGEAQTSRPHAWGGGEPAALACQLRGCPQGEIYLVNPGARPALESRALKPSQLGTGDLSPYCDIDPGLECRVNGACPSNFPSFHALAPGRS